MQRSRDIAPNPKKPSSGSAATSAASAEKTTIAEEAKLKSSEDKTAEATPRFKE